MAKIVASYVLLILTVLTGCRHSKSQPPANQVRTGAEILIGKHLDELSGRRVGLVMNPTARVDGVHMLDTLISLDVNITALFAPEHGFRGEAGAGEVIEDGVDLATGLPVFSLYGKTKKPTPEMLDEVDLLLFDMQDVGARFYTYNVTMGRVIEAAAEEGIAVWILDRPNPAGGDYVSGWRLDPSLKSFVGAYPVPMAHGLTLGELAMMAVGEGWLEFDSGPEIRIIEMEGWKREMKWPDTGLEWHPPSPNLPTFMHAYAYLGTVLFEGTNLSEGRGTPDPFLTAGSPKTDISDGFIRDMNSRFDGVRLDKIVFTPRSIPGKAVNPKFEGESCTGVGITVTDPYKLDPVAFGSVLVHEMIQRTEGGKTVPFLYRLAGTKNLNLASPRWNEEVGDFKKKRKPYLIYD